MEVLEGWEELEAMVLQPTVLGMVLEDVMEMERAAKGKERVVIV